MVNITYSFLLIIFAFYFLNLLRLSSQIEDDDKKDYIVYMGSISNQYSGLSQHINTLEQVVEGRPAEETMIRSYNRSFSGFAARLTEKEYENLKGMEEVVSIFPSTTYYPQTTRSWDFLGLPEPNSQQQMAQSDIIIGVIDSGIWSDSPSFYDDGLGPVPEKWKGGCHGGLNFPCNRKIIGVREYVGSVIDHNGHGSHCGSIAAGRKVEDVDFFRITKGTARGGVPSSRIAVYKACDDKGCEAKNILKAFDDAVADGVDLITISLSGKPADFFKDPVAIGAFHAMARGVLTVQCAGNEGSDHATVSSNAPWLLSVAASTTDRRIFDEIVLGNGKTIFGNAVNTFTLNGTEFPLVYGKAVTTECDEASAQSCEEACLERNLVKGKIVVCDFMDSEEAVIRAGDLGQLSRSSYQNISTILASQGTLLNEPDFQELLSYLKSSKAPKASIFKSKAMTDSNAPTVAQFSSRGPNTIASDILKPDITAPGVTILAAYSPIARLTDYPGDKRRVSYNIQSGTSMACPHVAGAAAYLKSIHPHWSPAAIKSSLMTTADPMEPWKNLDGEFAYGSGHLNPAKAATPGLIYEANITDYVQFLCKSGYNKTIIRNIMRQSSVPFHYPKKHVHHHPKDMNYPSMSALVNAGEPFKVKFIRRVTNVGYSRSTYTAKFTPATSSSIIKVSVKPDTLNFSVLKEIKSYKVTVVAEELGEHVFETGSIVWSDGTHSVRSPIVVYTK